MVLITGLTTVVDAEDASHVGQLGSLMRCSR
jgi:hypothetical protein